MSNTRHALPQHCMHHMRVQNRRKAEEAALDELTELDVPFRHRNRLTSFWTQCPEPWDDKPNAAWGEYHNKNYWVRLRAQNDEHSLRVVSSLGRTLP